MVTCVSTFNTNRLHKTRFNCCSCFILYLYLFVCFNQDCIYCSSSIVCLGVSIQRDVQPPTRDKNLPCWRLQQLQQCFHGENSPIIYVLKGGEIFLSPADIDFLSDECIPLCESCCRRNDQEIELGSAKLHYVKSLAPPTSSFGKTYIKYQILNIKFQLLNSKYKTWELQNYSVPLYLVLLFANLFFNINYYSITHVLGWFQILPQNFLLFYDNWCQKWHYFFKNGGNWWYFPFLLFSPRLLFSPPYKRGK